MSATPARLQTTEHHPTSPVRVLRRYLAGMVAAPLLVLCFTAWATMQPWFLLHDNYDFGRVMGYGLQLKGMRCQVVIYGDSTAMADVDPKLITARTGLTACNIAETRPVEDMVGVDFPLDEYLAHNQQPRYLVTAWTPSTFNFDRSRMSKPHHDGYVYALQFDHGWWFWKGALMHLDSYLPFLNWAMSSMFSDTVKTIAGRNVAKVGPNPQEIRKKNLGMFTFTNIPERQCSKSDSAPLTTQEDNARAVHAFRARYEAKGMRVFVDVTPIADCVPHLDVLRQLATGVVDNRFSAVPVSSFDVDNTHLVWAGAERFSEEIARQILAAMQADNAAKTMTFSNPVFYWFFLPASLLGFALLSRVNGRFGLGFLSFMSLLFYAAWSPKYLFVLIGSLLFNLAISHGISRSPASERERSWWLFAGIAINLGALAYYKYLFPSLNALTAMGTTHKNWGSVILPLGISFFTFTQIAYLVDLRQGIAAREDLLNYTLFVSFFPHLIAGPIVHHGEIMPQFRQPRRSALNLDDLTLGLTWFAMGLFKKAAIADSLSASADRLFSDPTHAGVWSAWFGVLTYAMQLYFDFSGYSDMALGLARMFSIRFPLNFNSPFKATSIIEFWQRWHITLSSYINDYLYAPILKNAITRRMEAGKKSNKKAQATAEGFTTLVAYPTMTALLIAGVWHGAGLQFLLYGLMHGCYLTINHAWRTFVPANSAARRMMTPAAGAALTFFAVVLSFVMFRADGTASALLIYRNVFGANGLGPAWSPAKALVIAALLAVVWLTPNTQEILGEQQKDESHNWSLFPSLRWRPAPLWWAVATVTFVIGIAYSTANSTFLYFQF